MAILVTAIDLEMAAKNTKYVFDSAKGKKKYYLTANFGITQKEKEQAKAADLVNAATKLFFASQDPQKLATATGIFTHLTQMAPSADVATRVQQVTPLLEKARLKEIPRQLSMMLQLKEFLGIIFRCAETGFATHRAMKFRDEHTVTISVDERAWLCDSVLKKPPSPKELEQLLSTTEGLAFAQRYPMILDGKRLLNLQAISPEEQQLLRRFISRSDLCSPYAAKLYWFIETNKAFKENNAAYDVMQTMPSSCAFMMPFTGPSAMERNPYFEPTCPYFLNKTLPSFTPLGEYAQKIGNVDFRNYALHVKLYDLCKGVNAEMPEFDAHYRALFDEYNALSQKFTLPGQPAAPLPASCFPSLFRGEGAAFVFPPLPTPGQYAAIPCSLAVPDFSPSFPPLPAPLPTPKPAPLPTPKPAHRVTAISVASDRRMDEKDHKDAKASPVREDVKEELPSRASPFANRTFAFSQKAQRVLEWETDPKTPLAGESYLTLSPDLQKEQTWRHGCSVLDPFVGTDYSRKGEWTNNRGEKQTAYFIQAEVECQGKTTRCVFQYAFDKDMVLYHRYAGERSNIQIVDDLLAKNRYENDFPTLDKSFELFKTKPATVKVDVPGEARYSIDPLEVITIKDDKYDLIIRIFKQG